MPIQFKGLVKTLSWIVGLPLCCVACAPPKVNTYVPVAGGGIPANGGAGVACGAAFPPFNVPNGATASGSVYELINKGTCDINVTATPPRGAAIASTVPPGGRFVQALPPYPGQNVGFALQCARGEQNCNFDLRVAEEQQVAAPAPSATFTLSAPPAVTVETAGANKCTTGDNDAKPILIIKNSSRKRQRVEYTVTNTCGCAAFVVGTLSAGKGQTSTGFRHVAAGDQVVLQAFCTGSMVSSPCTGTITNVRIFSDPT